MGRGYRKKQSKGTQADGVRGVSDDGQDRIRESHYDEHRQNVWEAIREASQNVSASVGGRSRDVVKAVAGAGLAGVAAGVGAATIAPAAALVAPAAAAFIGWRAYHSWNTSLLWRNSTFGRALAQTFGTDEGRGSIKSIGKVLATRSLASLGTAGAASLALGTPVAPVAIAAMGGYAAYKGVRLAMHKRRLEKHDQAREEAANAPGPIVGGMPALENLGQQNANQSSGEPESAEEVLSPKDSVALQRATNAANAAIENFRSDVAAELGNTAVAEGRDFADGIGPEAEEARTLTYLARSRHVEGAENEAEIRKLVGETEANFYAESKPGKKRLDELQKSYETLEGHRAEIAERAQELEAQRAELESRGRLTREVRSAVEEEMEMLNTAYENVKSDQDMIAAEVESLGSEKMGQIDGLINLTATGNMLRCARCGTVPKTVRVRCSKCGMPFVATEEQREYVGIGDEGLREKGKMDLIEKYEGDAEVREKRWAASLEGKIVHRHPDDVKANSGKAKKDQVPSGKAAATSKDTRPHSDSSRNALKYSKWNAEDSLAALDPQGEYSRDQYLKSQAARRSGDNPEAGMFLVGHDKALGSGGEHAELTQGEAMMEGVMGWDWNKKGEQIRPGDTVAVRRNGKTEGKVGKIDGFFTVGEKMELTLPSMEDLKKLEPGAAAKIWDANGDADPAGVEEILRKHRPELMAAVDKVADKIMESTDEEYYPRERVIESILVDLAQTKSSTFSFLRVEDPQKLDDYYADSLAGGPKGVGQGTVTMNGTHEDNGSRLKRTTQLVADTEAQSSGKKKGETDEEYAERVAEKVAEAEARGEAAEKLMKTIEERRADAVESTDDKKYPRKNFNRDEKGLPRVCGVRTTMGTPCRNPATRGSNYCWQHQGGPREDRGEKTLSRPEIEASARNIRNHELTDRAPASIRGRDKVDDYFNSLSDDHNDPKNQELLAQCGMTKRELAQYANSSIIEGCRPDENDAIALQLTHKDQIPLAEAAAEVARVRGITLRLIYPTTKESEQRRKDNEFIFSPNVVCASIDQVGGGGKRIVSDGKGGYREMTKEEQQAAGQWDTKWDDDRNHVTMSPTRAWAEYLSENSNLTGFSSDKNEALRQLGQDLYNQARAYSSSAQRQNIEDLEGRAARLKDLDVRRVSITGPGTNLSMELTDATEWVTVDMLQSEDGKETLVNGITEEVFATPKAGSLRGEFTSTAPLNFTGAQMPGNDPVVAEQVRGKFDEDGQLVELQAYKKNAQGEWVEDDAVQKEMEKFFFGEEGRPVDGNGKPLPFPQCGEVALVDSENPVAATGRNYLIPMIDENGGIHIAIGNSYAPNGGGAENGGSEHDRHVDVKIGSSEVSVTGISNKTGEEVTILDRGRFVL